MNDRFQPEAQDHLDVPEETPLLNAARNGHDGIVAYLLQFRKVLTDLKEQEDEVDNARVS